MFDPTLSPRVQTLETAVKNLLLLMNGLQWRQTANGTTGSSGALSSGAKRILAETADLVGIGLPEGPE
jgi:hypothetical protein